MHDQLVCLMTGGLYITDAIRNLLLLSAYAMIDAKQRAIRVKYRGCEGAVESSFATVGLGHFGGIRFDATLDVGARTFHVSYIVDASARPKRVEDIAWHDVRPQPCAHEPN